MTSFICNINATAKEDVKVLGDLLFVVWLFVRFGHHGVVFLCVWPFPSLSGFKNGSSSDTTNYPVCGIQSIEASDRLRSLASLSE